MSKSYTVWVDESRAREVPLVGGKFANIAKLHISGVSVPIGFSVSTDAFQVFMESPRRKIEEVLAQTNYNDMASLEKASERIRSLCRGSEMPEEIRAQIVAAYRELARRTDQAGSVPVAVRSSATSEDLQEASMAGQHETFLWVRGEEAVVDDVKECWASIFSSRSMKYRREKNLTTIGDSMAVVVQMMVRSLASGVMFTLNPSNGDPSKILIESSWGLGEAIVSGTVTPDRFMVDKVTFEMLERHPSRKAKEFTVLEDGLEEREVPEERQLALSLSDEEALELAKLGKSIEKLYGSPQDIEWAVDHTSVFPKNIFILQSRPETVWSKKERGALASTGGALDIVLDKLMRGEKLKE